MTMIQSDVDKWHILGQIKRFHMPDGMPHGTLSFDGWSKFLELMGFDPMTFSRRNALRKVE
jgi:hypothetical protein